VDGFDGAAYAAWLGRHRLLPWVEPAVLGEAGRRRLPSPLVDAVAAGSQARHRRHAEVVAETFEVQDAFDRAGIPCLHLKGLCLGTRFHGDPERRHQRDVDVLVHARDREAAFAALEARGYAREPGEITEGVVRWGLRRGYADVDVHWNLRRRSRRRFREEDLWRDPLHVPVAGRTLATMGDEATLTFLLLAVCGDLRRGACQGRHLLDVYLVARALAPTLDAEAFLARRARERAQGPCVNVLAVLFLLFDLAAELPDVARAIERRARLVHVRDVTEAAALLDRPRQSPENEAWFQRAYPYDRWNAWGRRLTVDLPYAVARLVSSRRFTLGDALVARRETS
jgi:hypothetical protein